MGKMVKTGFGGIPTSSDNAKNLSKQALCGKLSDRIGNNNVSSIVVTCIMKDKTINVDWILDENSIFEMIGALDVARDVLKGTVRNS